MITHYAMNQLRDGTQMQTSRLSTSRASSRNAWNTRSADESRTHFACPDCGSRELKLAVTLTGMVTYRFSADEPSELIEAGEFSSEFPTLGDCSCPNCGWTGLSVEASSTGPE